MSAPPAPSTQLAEEWRPYVDACVEAFGPKRCMFESNFPVDRATCEYDVLWNAFKILGGELFGRREGGFVQERMGIDEIAIEDQRRTAIALRLPLMVLNEAEQAAKAWSGAREALWPRSPPRGRQAGGDCSAMEAV